MSSEFTIEQTKYLNSSIDKSIFLEACPGSGKTEIVAAKVAKEIACWNKHPGGIAVLSFANSATDELTERISTYLDGGRILHPHFIGTFDSFIYKNIVSPLSTLLTSYMGTRGDASIKIVEPSAHIGYISTYSYGKRGKVYAHHYSPNINDDGFIFDTGEKVLDRVLNAIDLTDWQKKDLLAKKTELLNGGFATYRDIEYLAIQALTQEKYQPFITLLAKRYPLIIIDECQDLSIEQLVIMQVFLDCGMKLHFIGDLHQAIYGFRDVDPVNVENFVNDNNFEKLELTRNFRSCQNIINICSALTGRKNIYGNVTWLEPRCFVIQYKNDPTETVGTLDRICEGYKESVILSRGHSNLLKFQTSEKDLKNIQKLALAIRIYDSDNMEKLAISLQLFSEFIRYYLKESSRASNFNCPHSIDSVLSWRLFLSASLIFFKNSVLNDMNVTWSTWTKKAKVLVRSLSSQVFCPDFISLLIAPLNELNISSPSGFADKIVDSSLGSTSGSVSSYRKSTIHGSKGETHDITIVISSSKSGNGSHWHDWLNNPMSEAARFAYVASSRPRHYLVWCVRTLNKKNKEKEKLESIGFTVL